MTAAGAALRRAEAGAVLTVDLPALRANYRFLRDRAAPAVCAAVVKADGYGLGAALVGSTLAAEGCQNFFVAHLSEARDLMPALPAEARVFVLNGLPPGSEVEAAALGAVPVLNSPEQVAAWRQAAAGAERKLPAALHVDTGMSRLGLSPDEVLRMARDPEALAGIDLRLVMSHLASAEAPGDPSNARQLAAFELAARGFHGVPRSLANSSGIFLGAAFAFELVRPGAALYGVNPRGGGPNPMRPVLRLDARAIQLRELRPGDAVGYGGEFVADRPLPTATLSIGYGDGWPRRARTAAFFRGARLPIIGRISMDSCVVDLSALAPGALRPGDFVEMIGPRQSVDDVAAAAGTIGYEILTSLGGRFHREAIVGPEEEA